MVVLSWIKDMTGHNGSILKLLSQRPFGTAELTERLGGTMSLATVKRRLSALAAEGVVCAEKSSRNVLYSLSPKGRIFLPVEPGEYFEKEQDERGGLSRFNFEILPALKGMSLFTPEELLSMDDRFLEFRERVSKLPPDIRKKEMDRLGIDLSWKSSQIEGNTYTLLQTERLLKESLEARGKSRAEAVMLLNHKAALDVITSDPDFFRSLDVGKIENVHSLLVKGLEVSRNVRTCRVGITGTNYVPPDNEFTLREALSDLCEAVNGKESPYEKALLCLLMIGYIQPFGDGNKRTSRLMANAALLSAGHCPLSFRTVDPGEYKESMLIFCEQNSILAFKRLFIEQYKFSADNYF